MSLFARWYALLVLTVPGFAMVACSPVFNWRETSLEGADLVALLPCKPDRASRDLPLGSEAVHVTMAGCEAGDATFAVAHASASDATQAQNWLAAWHAQALSQWQGAQIDEAPATVLRAATAPPPVQFAASRQAPDGRTAQVRTVWFAQTGRNGRVSVYQATVLGTPSAKDAATTFFEGLRLP
ncbi:hypothetical protein QTI66_25900 [Variovorax sp. J22R133]|uniref:hypothetical protein n=1 Tax=Variovorax brevis TaxID=3053503 RepID=UPI0025771B39|nr:hypothetical protein [Variovorax sp. J22R133]MDM0115610.1 hypothetical protein [Variovorax sp. J22R133]